jgi:hypothetical protein
VKSKIQQGFEKLQLKMRCFVGASEYDLYGFARRDIDYRYMLNFLTTEMHRNRFRLALNDPAWKVLLDNKWVFALYYEEFGIPLPKTLGMYDPVAGITKSGERLSTSGDLLHLLLQERPQSLAIKPVGGIMGQGVIILKEIRYSGSAVSAVINTGHEIAFSDLSKVVDRQSGVQYYMAGGYELDLPGYILQEKVEQHEVLNNIAPYTLNTLRIVTFLDHAGDVDVHFAVLRVGRKGNVGEQWNAGGLSIAVNPESGVLGAGVLKPKYGGNWVETHPDSGTRFKGQQLPFWDEVLNLCIRAAKITPRLRTIGWDVALTPSGPVLIEGNPDWDLPMVQIHTSGYLQPRVREQLAHFGLTFPERTLPPVSLRQWWVHFRERAREERTRRRWARSERRPAVPLSHRLR